VYRDVNYATQSMYTRAAAHMLQAELHMSDTSLPIAKLPIGRRTACICC
jgi:hypothetical protein